MPSTRAVRPFAVAALLSAAGCSEAVPVASEGAFSVTFVQAAAGTSKCIVGSHNSQVGSVTAADLDALAKDTVAGASVQCSVTPGGGGFAAAGVLEDALSNHIDFRIPSIAASATEANPALGSVGFRSTNTQNMYRSPGDVPCKFWFDGNGQIDGGRIWMSFRCEQVDDPGHDSSCQIGPGSALAMQNCDQ